VIGRALWQCHGTLSTAEYRMTFPSENHAACCSGYVLLAIYMLSLSAVCSLSPPRSVCRSLSRCFIFWKMTLTTAIQPWHY